MDYRDLIKQHEGYRPYVYLDTEGIPTCGWGHAFLKSPRPAPGNIFSEEQCIEFFEDDMQTVERGYCWIEKAFVLEDLDWVRRGVLKNMLFNLGIQKLMGFRKMVRALLAKDYERASEEMLDSKWARQVKGRARTLAQMMRTGKWILS